MVGEWVIQRYAECAHPAFRAAARTPNVRSAGGVDGRTRRRRQQWRRGGGDRALRRGGARRSVVEHRVVGIAKRRRARSACRREGTLGEGNGRWWEWAARPIPCPLLIPCTHARTRTRTPATRFDAPTEENGAEPSGVRARTPNLRPCPILRASPARESCEDGRLHGRGVLCRRTTGY